jgi:hypothetical protein
MSYKTSTYSIELTVQHLNGTVTKNIYTYRGIDHAMTAAERYCQPWVRGPKVLGVEVRREGIPFLYAEARDNFCWHSIDLAEFPEERASRAGEPVLPGTDYARRVDAEATELAEEQRRLRGEPQTDWSPETPLLGVDRNPENDYAYGLYEPLRGRLI